ncbi:MAG: ABC transporter permease [Vicinamibacteria bacterium]|nr:ABC transporter permease [Vicinamibacteria bacterium]
MGRPAFPLVVITTLGLGIGASTAAFSMGYGILVRSLPYREPDALVRLWETNPQRANAREATSISNFADWRGQTRSFEGMAAAQRPGTLTLTSAMPAVDVRVGFVSPGYFEVLGVGAASGRVLGEADDVEGGSRPVVITEGFWRRQLGARRDAVGARLQFEAKDFDVIGVLPAEFVNPGGDVDVFLPIRIRPTDIDRGQNYLQVIGRLRRDVGVQEAQAEVDQLAARLAERYPAANRGRGITLVPLLDETVGGVRRALLLILGAVTLVLLVACSNIANLFFLRNVERRHEMAIRTALGASRFRILRQLILEAGALSCAGAALGVAVAAALIGLVKVVGAAQLPRLGDVRIDGAALAYASAICLFTTLLFGLLPSRDALVGAAPESLRIGGRNTVGDSGRSRLRGALVVSQIALTLVLLVGAGLLTRSLAKLASVPPGFQSQGVMVARMSLGDAYDAFDRNVAYFREVTDALRQTPGIAAAGAVTVSPLNPFGIDFDVPYHRIEDPEPARSNAAKARFRAATPGYFEAVGMAVLKGRSFRDADREDAPRVVLVNQALADAAWPGADPVGRTIRFFWSDWRSYEVVGVVGNARSYGLAVAPRPELFVPNAQIPYSVMSIVVRAADEGAAARRMLEVVRARDPLEPPIAIVSMSDLVSDSIAKERFAFAWLSGLAVLAMVLAALGIYSAISFATGQRRREIGLRIALGSTPAQVERLFVRSGAGLSVAGVAIGLLGVLVLNRLIGSLLFEVSSTDLVTLLAGSGLLMALALSATWIPARRAAAMDPIAALRDD